MTTETVLTPEQVDVLLEGVLRASGSRLGNYTYQKTLDELRSSIRAMLAVAPKFGGGNDGSF